MAYTEDIKRDPVPVPQVATHINGHTHKGTGTVYLTSGGRIVIDCGWGEYFGNRDTPICSLEELRRGFSYRQFIRLLQKTRKGHETTRKQCSNCDNLDLDGPLCYEHGG